MNFNFRLRTGNDLIEWDDDEFKFKKSQRRCFMTQLAAVKTYSRDTKEPVQTPEDPSMSNSHKIFRRTLRSCGGSLISSKYVLTSATCVALPIVGPLRFPYNIKVTLGDLQANTKEKSEVNSLGIGIPHQNFGSKQKNQNPFQSLKVKSAFAERDPYNIALVYLLSQPTLTAEIQTIALPAIGENVAIGTQ
ncbi:unnamed protein product, partial [Notodromas monacha]